MVRYKEFIEAVGERLAVTDVERIREAVARIVYGLLPWLPPDEQSALGEALPAPLRPALRTDGTRTGGDADQFVHFVAARERYPAEHVRYEAQAVLSTLDEREPELGRRLRAALPDGFGELFRAPGGGPPPDLAAGRGVPPAELTDDDIAELLRHLPDWTGDRHRLARPVGPPDYLAEQLLARIRQVERQLNHRAVVTPQPDGSYLIEIWTHSKGLVTDLDAALARTIQDVIDDVLG
jgi:pterin-4a-carbinolamine dehydratase/uncharacterized protein (DUF2267 family)